MKKKRHGGIEEMKVNSEKKRIFYWQQRRAYNGRRMKAMFAYSIKKGRKKYHHAPPMKEKSPH